MVNNFSIEQAREQLSQKMGIPTSELIHSGVSKNGEFTQHHFYRKADKTIVYTVLSQEEVEYCEEVSSIEYAP